MAVEVLPRDELPQRRLRALQGAAPGRPGRRPGSRCRPVRDSRPLTFTETATLIAEAADAVDYAHGMGLVHRDLKPANIMVEYDRPRFSKSGEVESGAPARLGKAMVMDFGLALRDEVEITMTQDGHILGTPAYMSPPVCST